VSDVKNFLQLYQDIESSGINIILSLIIVSIAFYFYLGIFPFQAPYINFSNKAEPSSLYLLWLFYFPAGIIALLKFTPIISILNKNLKAGSYILYILLIAVFLGSTGSGIAGLKTKSLRKIASYIFTLIFIGYFINMAMLITGFIKDDNLSWLNIYYLAFIALNFLPLAFIFSFIENASKKDSVDSLRSLVYKDKFIGIAFLISMFSLIGIPGLFGYPGKKYYIDLIINIFKADTNGLTSIQGWLIMIIVIIYIAAFTAVSLRLIILLFMKENKDTDTISQYNFSKAFYVLIGIFMVLILFFGIIGLLETLNPGINLLGSRITNSAIFTKNLK
jgi:NADH:ubiquinone oxidoreductase subunit 2 (subunit N)